jgi:pimeloyl-ACP methyl ester carboxylesterase
MDAPVIEKSPLPSAQISTNDRAIIRIPAPIRLTFQAASRISPWLGSEIGRQLFFRPVRSPYRDEQHAVLARAQSVSLQTAGSPVQAYSWGSGPAVLLVHGWSGHSGQMTEFVAPLTRAGYRVVAVDAPGHGRSAGRLSSIVHFRHAIVAAAAAFGPLHGVIAHSLGTTAVVHALATGVAVKRAVFMAPQTSLTGYWDLFRETVGMSDTVWDLLRARSERWLKIRYDELHPAGHAPRMNTPLLVLHGLADRMTPVSEGKTLAALWPGARFQALDSGHLAILRDSRSLLASLDFLKG